MLALACGLALPAASAFGQPSLTASIGGSLDSYSEASQELTLGAAAGFLGAEYLFADERGSLFYDLDVGRHSASGDWSFVAHEAGLVGRLDLREETARLYLGGSASWRSNGEAWSYADYRALGAFANLELRPSLTTTVRLGYRVDARNFPHIPELDQLEQDGFASVLLNFPTRTTLIGELHLGTKSYEGAGLGFVAPDTQAHSSSQARGMGPSLRTPLAAVAGSGERAHQLSGLVRLAQSLADRTGASVQFSWRNAGGAVPPAVVTTPPDFFGDGVYDDPFASSARSWRLGLKHVFGAGLVAEASGAWLDREFTATPALQEDGSVHPGGELRQDRLWRATAGLKLPLFPARTGRLALDLECGYSLVHHRSNDAFYSYTSHSVGAVVLLNY